MTPKEVLDYIKEARGDLCCMPGGWTWLDGTKSTFSWQFSAGSTMVHGKTIEDAIERHRKSENDPVMKAIHIRNRIIFLKERLNLTPAETAGIDPDKLKVLRRDTKKRLKELRQELKAL